MAYQAGLRRTPGSLLEKMVRVNQKEENGTWCVAVGDRAVGPRRIEFILYDDRYEAVVFARLIRRLVVNAIGESRREKAYTARG